MGRPMQLTIDGPAVPHPPAWTHYWRWHKFLGLYYGEPCRIWARGSNGNLGLEFRTGHRVVAPRWAVRRLPQPVPAT